MNIQNTLKLTCNKKKKPIVFQIKSDVRPIGFLFHALLSEHYKNRTGTVRRQVKVVF